MANAEGFYNKHYKKLMLIPLILLIISVGLLIRSNEVNGDIINKDISLKGGLCARFYTEKDIPLSELEAFLTKELDSSFFIRELEALEETQKGFLIETENIDPDTLEALLEENFSLDLNDNNFFIEETESRLGEGFYQQMIDALWAAFLVMGLVVYFVFGEKWKNKALMAILTIVLLVLIFKYDNQTVTIISIALTALALIMYAMKSIPSLAVILSAIVDIVVTVAVINIIGMRVSVAGIAALLLLLGYSVDTDILLNTRILKERVGSFWERMRSSMKTGLTMTLTTITAMTVGFIVSSSLIIKEMFLIIIIGLIVDIVATYLMNTGILKWYTTRKNEN